MTDTTELIYKIDNSNMSNTTELIYKIDNSTIVPQAIPCTLGVKFSKDMYIAKCLLDKWNIPYKEEDLEDGPWGKCLRIKRDQ